MALIKLVTATLRYRWHDASGYFKSAPREGTRPIGDGEGKGPTGKGKEMQAIGKLGAPAIYATWHNRLIMSMRAYFRYVRKHNDSMGMAAMVSASKDGGFLAAILQCFGAQPVRGSSSRRGAQALLELTTWAERGFDLAITPDGPRGPRYEVQDGVMSMAQVTGLPIIPFSCYLGWKIQANSWDKFQIPLPFSVCEMNFGKPVYVPRDATDAEREVLRQQLENTLRSISRD